MGDYLNPDCALYSPILTEFLMQRSLSMGHLNHKRLFLCSVLSGNSGSSPDAAAMEDATSAFIRRLCTAIHIDEKPGKMWWENLNISQNIFPECWRGRDWGRFHLFTARKERVLENCRLLKEKGLPSVSNGCASARWTLTVIPCRRRWRKRDADWFIP